MGNWARYTIFWSEPMPVSTCPTVSELEQLATGLLSAAQTEILVQHLERCQACLDRLAKLSPSDTLADLLTRAKTLSGEAQHPLLTGVIERLSQMGQTPAAGPKPLALACAACGKSLRVKAELAGKKVKCPGCGQVIAVPAAAQPQTPAAPAAARRDSVQDDRTLPPPSAVAVPAPARVTTDKTALPLSAASRPAGAGISSGKTPSQADATQALPGQHGDQEALDFLRPAQQPDELGRLGQYRILKKLGAGGMGMVLLAEDTLLQRKVALKVMLPQFAANTSARERFLREARAAASIEHEHIVAIFQVGEDNQVPFLAMPFLKGEPLDARLDREGKLPLAEALRIAREMAEGLAAAHASNLIHRDIKPGNVWLESASPLSRGTGVSPVSLAGEAPVPRGKGRGEGGKVKLLDFGLARAQDDTSHLTQSGAIVGTPAYMAPEQARQDQIDGRADLFSLGCVLYQMLTGQRPFQGKDTISLLMSLATETPTLPRLLTPQVPAAVSDLTMRLLAKNPDDRPANAQAVVDALCALESRDGTEVLVPSRTRTRATQQKTAAPRPRTPLFVGIGVAAALLLLIGGYAIYQIVIIRDKNNKEVARIKVPEGGKAEVVPDTRPEDGKYVPWAATHEQQAWLDAVVRMPLAQQIESVNRRMGEENKVPFKLVLEPQDGPPTKCTVTPGSPVAYANAIWPLLAWPSLTSLDLKKTAVTDFTPLARLPLTELQANLIVDNVKSEAALKSLATLKTVNGRPAAEYWAERAEIRKDIDDRVVNVPLLSLKDRMVWFIPVMKKLHSEWSEINNAKLTRDPATGWTTIYVAGGLFDISPVRALGVDAVHLRETSVSDLTPLAKTKVQSFAYGSFSGSRTPFLRDLSPLAGLPLKQLDLSAAPGVTDLSPLAGMKLESLSLHPNSGVTDLKVILDMPITSLALPNSITDLRPFKGMKLQSLACSTTDLSPVAGMPLESLSIGNARPADLSLLAGMKLKSFGIRQYRTHYEPDEKMLRAMPLETINGKPAAKILGNARGGEESPPGIRECHGEVAPGGRRASRDKGSYEIQGVPRVPHCGRRGGRSQGVYWSWLRGEQHDGAGEGILQAEENQFRAHIDGWTDMSPLMSLPIEEIEGTPAMITGNVMILRQMPALKTINGKPAKEVLSALK